MKQIKDNPEVFDSLWKTTDHEAVRLLKHYIHPQIIFLHVKSHQYNNKRVEDLPLEIRLNKHVDDLVTEHLSKPIQTHILNAPISIYINNKYIPNKYVPAIRSHCSSSNAKSYLMKKGDGNQQQLMISNGKKYTKSSKSYLSQKEKQQSNSPTDGYHQDPRTSQNR